MSLFQISCFVIFLVSFLFGFFTFLNNKKERLNILWFFTSLSIGIWSVGFFGVVSSPTYLIAWISQYFLDIGGIFIPVLFFNFILHLLRIEKNQKKISIFSWLIAAFLILLSFTSFFKKGMAPFLEFRYWVDPGPLYFLFPLSFAFFSIYAFILLVRGYKKTEDKFFKAQIKYVIFAQIFGVGGGITNFFPQLFRVYPFGNYLVAAYVVFISYAILKHHLFNIRVIATELFAFAICIALLIRVLLSPDPNELLVNGILFFAVAIFGVLLVRSVAKEVKQREQIEVMADDVRRAYEVEKKARETEKINREKAEGLTKELKRLETAKNQFIMATQHHLRTPLTSMRGYLDLIAGGTYGKVPPKLKEVLKKFEKSTLNEIQIVNELLDISQFQLGKEVVILQPDIDIESMLKEIVGEIKIEAEKKNLYLKVERPKEFLPKIKADPTKLKVALFNLVDNAVKYTKEGGVSIKVQTTDSKLQIAVKDTGMGVPKEELPDIFTRVFERSKEAQKSNTTGRGIGLYLTANIIKSHHGEIWAESEGVGKGSTFFVELPVG